MDCNEVPGDGYTRAGKATLKDGVQLEGNAEKETDGDEVTWSDVRGMTVEWAYHPALGVILVKPDPGDSKTHKLLQQLIEKLDRAIGILTLIHRGIK